MTYTTSSFIFVHSLLHNDIFSQHGKEYNATPARKLSQSFDLDIVGGKAITAKQTLLSAIDAVITSHVPLKRSEDSQLKAFVCFALK